MTASQQDFDVFLSHNSQDKPAVRALATALKQRGLRVWLDEWELTPGQPWQDELEAIIRTTKSVAVLVGADGLGPWEHPEMRACLNQCVQRQLPVIPVLLPNAGEQPALPLFLQQFTWVDLRGGLTEEGMERLVWGITQVKPKTGLGSLPGPAKIWRSGRKRRVFYLLLTLLIASLVAIATSQLLVSGSLDMTFAEFVKAWETSRHDPNALKNLMDECEGNTVEWKCYIVKPDPVAETYWIWASKDVPGDADGLADFSKTGQFSNRYQTGDVPTIRGILYANEQGIVLEECRFISSPAESAKVE